MYIIFYNFIFKNENKSNWHSYVYKIALSRIFLLKILILSCSYIILVKKNQFAPLAYIGNFNLESADFNRISSKSIHSKKYLGRPIYKMVARFTPIFSDSSGTRLRDKCDTL